MGPTDPIHSMHISACSHYSYTASNLKDGYVPSLGQANGIIFMGYPTTDPKIEQVNGFLKLSC